MSKWARVNLEEDSEILEIISYNPEGVINEAFLPSFKPCPDEVERGYHYNPVTNTFYLPDNYAKHPDFENVGYIPKGKFEIDENGFVIFPTPPKNISLEEFRAKLKLNEKLLWDNPETGTSSQIATINTIKQEFPLLVSSEETIEILNLLESQEIIGTNRAEEILNHFK